MSKLKRTALVTGASSGIGAAYSDRLAARGHDLILVARRRDRLEELAERLRSIHDIEVEVVLAELSDQQDLATVEAMIAKRPDIEVLVNCAGLGALGLGVSVDQGSVDTLIKVNILALTQLSLAAARAFLERKHGTIINIGSIIGLMPLPGAASYGASKAYVLHFSRALQAELASSDVTVQVVMPGMVRSEFFGGKPTPFPEHLFMSAETLVDSALHALDQGELICFPTLHDPDAWAGFDQARGHLAKELMQNGVPAERYCQALVV